MSNIEAQAEEMIRQVEAAVYLPLADRIRIAGQANAFADAHKSELPQWRLDELYGSDEFLQTGTQAGTAENPNLFAVDSDGVARPTSSAAKMQDASLSKQVFSQAFVKDLSEGALAALSKLGEGFTKGAAASLIKVAAAGTLLFALYAISKKKGWL